MGAQKRRGKRSKQSETRKSDVYNADGDFVSDEEIEKVMEYQIEDGQNVRIGMGDHQDEEIDEDEAFTTEDYEKYSHFSSKGQRDEDEGDIDEDEFDPSSMKLASDLLEDESIHIRSSKDDSSAHEAVLDVIFNLEAKNEAKKKKKIQNSMQVSTESLETSAVPFSMNMQDLLGSISQDANLSSLVEESSNNALPVPFEKFDQDAVDRSVTFKSASTELAKWDKVVSKNRDAPNLSFPLQESKTDFRSKAPSFISKFEPTTSLEKDLKALSELYQKHGEGKDDESNASARRDFEQRKQSEMRSLQFLNEIKNKHLRRIKSKKYRKIKKRQEERDGKDSDEEDVQNRRERERAESRFNLKLRNGSAFLKKAARFSGRDDAETVESIKDESRRSNALRERMEQSKVLEQSSDESEEEKDMETKEIEFPSKGVWSMKFMQEAVKRKEMQSQQLLKEIQQQEQEEEGMNALDDIIITGNFANSPITSTASNLTETSASKGISFTMDAPIQVSRPSLAPKVDISLPDKKERIRSAAQLQMDQMYSSKSDIDASNPWIEAGPRSARSIGTGEQSEKAIDVQKVMEIKKDIKSEKISLLDSENPEQKDLVRMAFANDDDAQIEEFHKEKEDLENEETAEKPTELPGWGSWVGEGVKQRKRRSQPEPTTPQSKRSKNIQTMDNVIINPKRNKAASKFMITKIPYPYRTKEQYERSLDLPLGAEWNTLSVHAKLNRARISTKQGVAIDPITMEDAKRMSADFAEDSKGKKQSTNSSPHNISGRFSKLKSS